MVYGQTTPSTGIHHQMVSLVYVLQPRCLSLCRCSHIIASTHSPISLSRTASPNFVYTWIASSPTQWFWRAGPLFHPCRVRLLHSFLRAARPSPCRQVVVLTQSAVSPVRKTLPWPLLPQSSQAHPRPTASAVYPPSLSKVHCYAPSPHHPLPPF